MVAEIFNSRPPASSSTATRLTQQEGLVGRAGDSVAIFEIDQAAREAAVARDRERSYKQYQELLKTQWVGQLLRHHFFHQLLRWKVWDDSDWGNPTFVAFATALVIAERLHLDIRSVDTDSVNWEAERGDEGLPSRLLFCAWTPSAKQNSLPAQSELVLPDPVYQCVLGQSTAVYRDTLNDPHRIKGLTLNEHIDDSLGRQQLSATPQAHEFLQAYRVRIRTRNVVTACRVTVRRPESPCKRKPQYDPETVDIDARQAAKRFKAQRKLEYQLTSGGSDVESDDSLELAVADAIGNSSALEALPELA